MEVGSLSVPVRADLGPIQDDLNRLKRLLGQTEGQTAGVNNEMQKMQRQTGALTTGIKAFGVAIAGAFSVNALRQFSDQATQMNNALRVAGLEGDNLDAVFNRLLRSAQRNYTEVDGLVTLYSRASVVQNELGASTEELLKFTDGVSTALRVAGTDAQSAQGALLQLSQALGAGTVRAEEFNSIQEGALPILQAVADGMEETGGSVAKLRNMVLEGELSSQEFFQAFLEGTAMLEERVAGSTPTIAQGFTVIRNSILEMVRSFNDASGVSGVLAQGLIFIGENLQRITSYVVTGTTAWLAYRAALLVVNSQLVASVGYLGAVRVALQRLMIATGVGALIVLVTELVTAIWQARSASESWGETWERVGQAFQYTGEAMKNAFAGIVSEMQSMWAGFASYVLTTSAEIASAFGATLDVAQQVKALDTASRQFGVGADIKFEDAAAALKLASEALGNIDVEVPDLGGGGGIGVGGGEAGGGKKSKAEREAERLREAYAGLIQDGTDFIVMQDIEQQAIGMTEQQAARLRAEFDLLNQAQRAGIELTPEQVQELTTLAHAMADAETETRKLQERYDFAKDTFKGFFGDLKSELQNGASIWEAFGTAAANALQKIADKALDMAMNGIFDMIFGAFGGGGGGGFLGSLFGGGQLAIARSGGIGLYANGTSFAPGGWSMVGERGPELMKLPAGTQVQANNRVTAPAMASFGGNGMMGGGSPIINIEVNGARGNSEIREMVSEGIQAGLQEYDTNQLPNSIQRVNEHPRMRY